MISSHTPHKRITKKTTSKQINLTTLQFQTPKISYPLTDLDMTLPKLDKLEAIEAKKPPPPLPPLEVAAVCLGSFGAMATMENSGNWRKPN